MRGFDTDVCGGLYDKNIPENAVEIRAASRLSAAAAWEEAWEPAPSEEN